MKIIAGAPAHNKMFVLPHYLKNLSKVKLVNERVFLANNCTDEEIALLKNHGKVYFMDDVESTADRTSGRYHQLVALRNRLLDIVFKENGADFFFSCDSDILVCPNIVKNLLCFKKDIISCLVYNDYHFSDLKRKPEGRIGNVMYLDNPSHFRHIKPIPLFKLIEVDLTGACYIISKKVYRAGVRYRYHNQGEDAGFCLSAKEKGFELFCWAELQLHMMTEKMLNMYLKDGNIKEADPNSLRLKEAVDRMVREYGKAFKGLGD